MLYVVNRLGKNGKRYFALVLRTNSRNDIVLSFDAKLICRLLSICYDKYVDYSELSNYVPIEKDILIEI